MKITITLLWLVCIVLPTVAQTPTPEEILKKIDVNMVAESIISEGKMTIYTKRGEREMRSKSYSKGETHTFTEYLYPEREKGTKMLRIEDRLWIYSPATDRTIQISGHMLRQSVMGSDLSYEDMMEERKLHEIYAAVLESEETIDDRKCWVLKLTATTDDVAYHSRKMWVDQERFVPLKEELFAKSGQMLKRVIMSNVVKIGKRWYPKKMNYKDMLKDGKGTDFEMLSIELDVEISDIIFNKASLTK